MKLTLQQILLFLTMLHGEITYADIAPSFELKENTWNSTHILRVKSINNDKGEFKVVESWKGGVEKNEVIHLPFLSHIHRKFSDIDCNPKHNESNYLKYSCLPDSVDCSDMVLFLRHDSLRGWKPVFTRYEDDNYLDDEAKFCEGMKISVAWLINDKIYAFEQIINPGPLVFSSIKEFSSVQYPYWKEFSISGFKEKINIVNHLKNNFLKAFSEKDVFAVYEFVKSNASESGLFIDDLAIQLALKGKNAFSVIRKMVDDTTLPFMEADFLLYYTMRSHGIADSLLTGFLYDSNNSLDNKNKTDTQISYHSRCIFYVLRACHWLPEKSQELFSQLVRIKDTFFKNPSWPYSGEIVKMCEKLLN